MSTALSTAGQPARAMLRQADLLARSGRTQKAIALYFRVAEKYTESEQYLKAVAIYKLILRFDQNQIDVNLRLAELYKELGLLSDAMGQYQILVKHYSRRGRLREALAMQRQIVDLDPESVFGHMMLAKLYLKGKMVAEAIAELEKVAEYLRVQARFADAKQVDRRIRALTNPRRRKRK